MPEITIQIGGRDFDVVCKQGEEAFLKSAAVIFDVEAQSLTGALGRIPENRMLLMAGLMLADKTANLEDQLASASRTKETEPLARDVTAEIAQLKYDLSAASDNLKTAQEALSGMEKELADAQSDMANALQAMKRMVVDLEAKGAE